MGRVQFNVWHWRKDEGSSLRGSARCIATKLEVPWSGAHDARVLQRGKLPRRGTTDGGFCGGALTGGQAFQSARCSSCISEPNGPALPLEYGAVERVLCHLWRWHTRCEPGCSARPGIRCMGPQRCSAASLAFCVNEATGEAALSTECPKLSPGQVYLMPCTDSRQACLGMALTSMRIGM